MPTFFDGDLIFVHIPKCAGTSIRNALASYQLSFQSKSPESTGFSWYRQHESLFEVQPMIIDKWGEEKWKNATIISTVRNPVDRVLSLWRYRRKALAKNFEAKKFSFSATNSTMPYITVEDYSKYHDKHFGCDHLRSPLHIEEFMGLSFDDFTNKMTVWKKSGCGSPSCPYHALAPQVCWLHDVNGEIRMDKLKLFLVERLDELESFLPDMKKIGHHNVTKKSQDDERVSESSLDLIKKFYAEDFKLYDDLKAKPLRQSGEAIFTRP